MAETRSAERSSIEIKDLLRKLHPERGNHKDRIRRLNRFRTYVMPASVSSFFRSKIVSDERFCTTEVSHLLCIETYSHEFLTLSSLPTQTEWCDARIL
jgi:hypothetical protein